MTNQFSNNVFGIEHPFWIYGSHNLKILLKWLTKLKKKKIDNTKNEIVPIFAI